MQEKKDDEKLSRTEEEVLQKQVEFEDIKISFFSLYHYATLVDSLVVAISAICALGAGACQPLPALVFGRVAYIFVHIDRNGVIGDDASDRINHQTLYFVYIAISCFVAQFVATAGFAYTGREITRRIKEKYMEAVLSQNMAIFDQQGPGSIASQLTSDANLIQEGLSQRLALTISAFGTLGSTFVICFILDWRLTLMLIWPVFLGIASTVSSKKISVRYSTKSLEAYSNGGSLVEEALGSIRSTVALGMQKDVLSRYQTHLRVAERHGFVLKSFTGILLALAVGAGYLNSALAFWQGSRMLVDGQATFKAVIAITIAMKTIAFSILNVGANVGSFIEAPAAGARLISMIRRSSPIDPFDQAGLKDSNIRGVIEFRDVKHVYPSRPNAVVTEHLSLTFEAGQTTAVVGSSGSGKSTLTHLIERFYDPIQGMVLLDGHDIRSLNLEWLRNQIRVVSQDPVLFNTTIRENIEFGLVGTPHQDSQDAVKARLVEQAAKLAEAHGFILGFPQGYLTMVGARGLSLSGGQRQRIAIARALIGDPRILILDEATSALDSETESKVQAALNASPTPRTTIIVAHRLSTIRHSNKIVVLDKGKTVEQGSHDQLIERDGLYRRLVDAQSTTSPKKLEPDTFPIYERENPSNQSSVVDTLFSTKLMEDDGEMEKKQSLFSQFRFMLSLNRKEYPIIFVGLVASVLAGWEEPVAAILNGEGLVAISLPLPEHAQEVLEQSAFWSWMICALAIAQCLVFMISGVSFAFCSEKLIRTARNRGLDALLHQDVTFFDRKENSAGALASFLSVEATALAGISGATLGTILIAVSTIVTCVAVSCAYGWKLGLVCSALIPVLFGCGYLSVHFSSHAEQQIVELNSASASYASEAVSAIQTVAALTREKDVLQEFKHSLARSTRPSLKGYFENSFIYALSQSLIYACMGLGFWWGGSLIIMGEYSTLQFVISYTAIVTGAFSAGMIFSFAPNMGTAAKASRRFQQLFNRRPQLDPRSTEGDPICFTEVGGRIDFEHVSFQYATRPDQLVLADISFTVLPGQHIALVGETGSGKSTVISLLERFYDVTSGTILLDRKPISSLNLATYRRTFGLVIQDPTLYNGTIRENMLFGLDPDSVTDEAIESACKDANILTFIQSLPDGFATLVGNRGSQLSGGQKQRLTLARALLRNPRILLLDEATSAVDSESESLIQEALERASQGCTTISIAHRLSTIKNADVIMVLHKGRIVESGTHDDLLRKRGKYFALSQASA
ncbi:GTPase-activating protein [Agyrium rufum]|nr:GTPase-activating protein [Agyrium rufum]